jgi:CIC family chloride channel protein
MLSVAVGCASGLGAVAFRGLIALFHNLFFLGRLSVVYDANVHTPPSAWGAFVLFAPVAGAVLVTFLVRTYAPEAKGSGVPEVMDASYYGRGVIRPRVAVVKALASSLGIGSGASVGREGPILQIGATVGAAAGRVLAMPVRQRVILIAAGAAGGISATFNTPIGGVLFATELILREATVRTLVPIMIASASATYVGQLFFGVHPSFLFPVFGAAFFRSESLGTLGAFAGLGVLTGLAATLFIRAVYGLEDAFATLVAKNAYLRHMAGMLLLGAAMVLFQARYGHYYVEGTGYATVQDVLAGRLLLPGLLVLLFAMKLLATALSLGSGGSGGIFSPCLFMGATLGLAYGLCLRSLFPPLASDLPIFAIAGMAGFVAAATGAALAAAVMIFEMTLEFSLVVPILLTVALSYGLRRLMCQQSFYTMKLTRRGRPIPEEASFPAAEPDPGGR